MAKNKSNKKSKLESSNSSNKILQNSEKKLFSGNNGLATSASRKNTRSYLVNQLGDGSEYLADNIINFLEGANTTASSLNSNIYSIMTNNLYGIEGMPYQFSSYVDRRIDNSNMGRKFADKVFARMPLLFLTPCTAVFMKGFNSSDRSTVASLFTSRDDVDSDYGSLIEGKGKFYTPQFAYDTYYEYLNVMLNAVAVFLGLGQVQINIGGKKMKLANAQWQYDTNNDFKTFFSAKENLVFYLDNFTEVSQSLSNSYGDSSLAATINGFADTANEIKFLFGADSNAISNAIGGTTSLVSSVMEGLSPLTNALGGGIVSSLASDGINTILNGGKIIFPQVWQDSSMEESYSMGFKFRSPDCDSLSIYLNVLKPYCKFLSLVMAHQDADNVNGYAAPFLVKAYCKGMFNIDLGAIASMNVTKGAECQWNDDGLPTQIDVSIDIQNLYSHLAMSKYGGTFESDIVNNTAYMDFLCNMAGLNIAQMEVGRRSKMRLYFATTSIRSIDDRIFNYFDRQITSAVGKFWDL